MSSEHVAVCDHPARFLWGAASLLKLSHFLRFSFVQNEARASEMAEQIKVLATKHDNWVQDLEPTYRRELVGLPKVVFWLLHTYCGTCASTHAHTHTHTIRVWILYDQISSFLCLGLLWKFRPEFYSPEFTEAPHHFPLHPTDPSGLACPNCHPDGAAWVCQQVCLMPIHFSSVLPQWEELGAGRGAPDMSLWWIGLYLLSTLKCRFG